MTSEMPKSLEVPFARWAGLKGNSRIAMPCPMHETVHVPEEQLGESVQLESLKRAYDQFGWHPITGVLVLRQSTPFSQS